MRAFLVLSLTAAASAFAVGNEHRLRDVASAEAACARLNSTLPGLVAFPGERFAIAPVVVIR